MNPITPECILLFFALVAFSFKRLRLLLHFYQQEEYDSLRFLRLVINKGMIDKKLSIVMLTCSLIGGFILVSYPHIHGSTSGFY